MSGALGLQIAATGAMCVLVAGVALNVIKKYPGPFVALPVIALFLGGGAAMVGGFLWWVWVP